MKKCEKCGVENDNSVKYCTECGEPLSLDVKIKKNQSKDFTIIMILLGLVLVGAVIGLIFQQSAISDANKKVSLAQSELASISENYSESYASMEELYDFYDQYIVFVNADDIGELILHYHKPYCKYFDTSNFIAYNIDQAKTKGFELCKYCFE
ncbi:MAG: hypothetical protein NC122_07445 [Faecalibacterium sp.]|nr:hypothetical protein [Ruminococcus sp.]MCM1392170.1 hypothetical protein [Ruminococcus sp.]MCM1486026.1 hypothetical protein [Faecalibacterium sp.]